jgi:general secretion pathway protein K
MRPERVSVSERGAALLTVLMLVAVIAVLAGGALEKLRLSTRLAGNAAAIEAARGYARAAETLALGRIDSRLGQAHDRVTLAGGWSGKPFGLPLPCGGTAVATVRDGGNCFNLNGLVTRTAPGVYVGNGAARLQFARLMRLVDVPGQSADGIAAAAVDWIDSDADQQPSGAEDGMYLGQVPSYRTAGTLMADVSELRAVHGVTPDIYARLRPWVCALPIAEPARINVNTLLPEQTPLLAMLLPDPGRGEAVRQALLRRPPEGFDSVDKFWSMPGFATGGGDIAQTAVTTTWFSLDIGVNLGGAAIEQHGLIDARHLPSHIVTRQWGEPS